MGYKMLLLLFVAFDMHALGLCNIAEVETYYKETSYLRTNPQLDMVQSSAPAMLESKNTLFHSHMKCLPQTGQCIVEQNYHTGYNHKHRHCPWFKAPENFGSYFDQVNLIQFGADGEYVIVDWATKAVVGHDAERRRSIQVCNLNSQQVTEIPMKLSARDNEIRKIVLNSNCGSKQCFEVIYVDFEQCGESGWAALKYDATKGHPHAPRCIRGLSDSKRKFALDAAVSSHFGTVVVEKNGDHWTINELSESSDRATALYTEKSQGHELFHLPRLSVDKSAVVCWLSNLTFSKDVDCTAVDIHHKTVKQFSLNFPSEVRDFEILNVGTHRVYVITSYSEPKTCQYNLWLFDTDGRKIDGPARIEGRPCLFEHRLNPRPTLALHNRDEICANFEFERRSYKSQNSVDRDYGAYIKCFRRVD